MYLPVIEPIDRLCSDAIECGIAGDISGARRRIDKVRAMRASLTRSVRSQRKDSMEAWVENAGINSAEVPRYREQIARLNAKLELIRDWISGSLSSFSHEELISSQEGLSLYVDSLLPEIWDFSQDVVVLQGAHRSLLLEDLKSRGQKRFVIITDEDEAADDLSVVKLSSTDFNVGADTVKVALFPSGSAPQAETFSGFPGEEVPSVALITIDSNPENERDFKRVLKSLSFVSLAKRSVREWPRIFVEQWFGQIPLLTAHESVMALLPIFRGQDILLASPGPSLYDSLPALRAHRHRFVVVAPIRSLLTLLKSGVVPDFAFHVDPTDFSHIIPSHPMISQVSLICTQHAHKCVFEIGFKQIYTAPDPAMVGNAISLALNDGVAPLLHGGSVATCAVAFAAQFEARSITLIGQDLSLSRGRYVEQAEGVTSGETSAPVPEDLDDSLTCEGINGARLQTQVDYLWFIGEMENTAKSFSPKVEFINSTSHGARLKGWQHKTLDAHPLLSSPANSESFPPSVERMSDDERETRRENVLLAVRSEQSNAEEAACLCTELVSELRSLIDSGSNDVTEVDALEARLFPILNKPGSVLHFYTSRFSMALAAASKSVETLEENLSISAEYYHHVASRAKTLASMLADAALGLESTSNLGVVGDVE